jgi:hypothetical protein
MPIYTTAQSGVHGADHSRDIFSLDYVVVHLSSSVGAEHNKYITGHH